ncbi:hypothetical protein TNCV_2986941 [Trichonephila clavipes]|nr:hypothetical protein TNCV_2986941 [Trichonephila clavipes]
MSQAARIGTGAPGQPNQHVLAALSAVAAVNKSSTSTQADRLRTSTSLVTVASPSISQPPNSVIDTAPTTSNSLSISAAIFPLSTACSVLGNDHHYIQYHTCYIPGHNSNLKAP